MKETEKYFWAVGFFTGFLCIFSQNMLAINIIPTPKQVVEKKGEFWLFQGNKQAVIVIGNKAAPKEKLAADYINKELKDNYNLPGLKIKVAAKLNSAEKQGNLILIGNAETNSLFEDYRQLLKNDETFLRKQKSGQAYILDFFANRENPRNYVAVLSGKEDQGTLYAAVSFTQLIRKEGDEYFSQMAQIMDYPDFEYRWTSFPLWSPAVPSQKNTTKIDAALRWKINVINQWGFQEGKLNPSQSKLALNRYAHERGIRLLSGYMASFGLKNRKSYPDGKVYKCIGENEYFQTAGYCPSNEELIDLKCKELKKYVEKTEPGLLFLHFLDNDFYYLTEKDWGERCPECRKKWPNDSVEATDGKAGAESYIYNRFCETVFSVKKENYNAQKDCLIIFTGAPYCNWKETDSSWEKEKNYYVNISKTMKYVNNVFFMTRELGPREDNTKMRISDLAEALENKGKGHKVAVYHYCGSQRRLRRNWPVNHRISAYWLAGAIISQSYVGADFVFFAGGTHAALGSEYSWNRKPAGGYWVAPKTRAEWTKVYHPLVITSTAPPEIFGKGKFFDKAYRNVYGEKAGNYLAEGLRPVNSLFPETSHEWLGFIDNAWSFRDSPELQKNWSKLFTQIADADRRAIEGIKSALNSKDLIPGKREELRDTLKGYRQGFYWADFARKEADFYFTWQKKGEKAAETILTELSSLLTKAPEGEIAFASERKKRLAKASTQLETIKDEAELYKKQLAALQEQAPEIHAKIKKELMVRKNYNLADNMESLKQRINIGVIGGGFSYLFKDENIGHCTMLKELTEEIMNYDVICYGGRKKLTHQEMSLIRNFISAGGGFLISGSTPYYMLGNGDLTLIADWLGAKYFGNYQGKLLSAFPSLFSQNLEGWLDKFESGKGRACLQKPLTGLPVLIYKQKRALIFLLANKYGNGRVIYSSYTIYPKELTYKILLWLGHNKLNLFK
ncbi:MAG: glycoside hydrolase family 20 zincin-like fold domain-containing protein [Victivallaceae bacterium]|nr:glycoside hydrolase family 20 zincin-like fold domain-containing protein [Victivallaceae bacterium]